MKYLNLFAVLFLMKATVLFSQPGQLRDILETDISLARSQGTSSVSYVHHWFVGKNERFMIGLGARFTGYRGIDQYYVTAPAQLTSGSRGPFVIFKQNIVENMDSLFMPKANVFALNAMLDLGYKINEKISVGFNIDATGFSFGKTRRGEYINGNGRSATGASITRFNALLVSDNDLGTLNSQLYARYSLNNRWSVRTGAQFLFTEYTTDTNVQQFPELNDRFRKKSLSLMLGVTFHL